MTDLILPMPMVLAIMLDNAERRQLKQAQQANAPLKAFHDQSGGAAKTDPALHDVTLQHAEQSMKELAYARKVSET